MPCNSQNQSWLRWGIKNSTSDSCIKPSIQPGTIQFYPAPTSDLQKSITSWLCQNT